MNIIWIILILLISFPFRIITILNINHPFLFVFWTKFNRHIVLIKWCGYLTVNNFTFFVQAINHICLLMIRTKDPLLVTRIIKIWSRCTSFLMTSSFYMLNINHIFFFVWCTIFWSLIIIIKTWLFWTIIFLTFL